MVYNVAAAYAVQVVLSQADAGNQEQSCNCSYLIISVSISHCPHPKRFESTSVHNFQYDTQDVTTKDLSFKRFLKANCFCPFSCGALKPLIKLWIIINSQGTMKKKQHRAFAVYLFSLDACKSDLTRESLTLATEAIVLRSVVNFPNKLIAGRKPFLNPTEASCFLKKRLALNKEMYAPRWLLSKT